MNHGNLDTFEETESSRDSFSKCRIVHLHSSLGVYGAERWTLALIRHLDQREFPSFVVSIGTSPGSDLFYHLLISNKLDAVHIPLPGKFSLKIILELRRILQKQGTCVLHTHGFKADVFGYFVTRFLPVKAISTIHGWSADEGLRIRFYEVISRIFLKKFDRVYALSPALFQGLLDFGFIPSKLGFILNAVDLSGIEFHFNDRNQLDPLRVLYAGRLCRSKGVLDLIRALGQFGIEELVSLKLLGSGPARTEAEALSSNLGLTHRVNFIGAVPDITPFLRESNVLVLPSYAEGIPRVIMEAFAAGVPVIGTALPGIRELIEHEQSGLLVPIADPPALASALQRIRENPGFALHLAQRARLLVCEKFSAQRMAQDFENEYRSLCHQGEQKLS